MKKLKLLLIMASLGAVTTSCHFGRHTVIVETGNHYHLRIESYGKVSFNSSGTGIAYISRGGYLEYQNNSDRLKAENDGYGRIQYELDADGQKLDPYGNGRAFIAQAVRVMIRKGYHSN